MKSFFIAKKFSDVSNSACIHPRSAEMMFVLRGGSAESPVETLSCFVDLDTT